MRGDTWLKRKETTKNRKRIKRKKYDKDIYKKNANKRKHKKNDKETLRNFLKNIRNLRNV